jgi:hypothetical protein
MLCVEGQISSCGTNIQPLYKFGSRAGNYQFFASKDLIAHKNLYKRNKTFTHIDGDEMDFRVTMLPGFRGGHVHDLAGTA